jgi:excisionase family DNA binding protein
MTGFMTIQDFCREYSTSRSTLYRLIKARTAPDTTKIGRRTLIGRAAAQAWAEQAERDGSVSTTRVPSLAEAQRGRR